MGFLVLSISTTPVFVYFNDSAHTSKSPVTVVGTNILLSLDSVPISLNYFFPHPWSLLSYTTLLSATIRSFSIYRSHNVRPVIPPHLLLSSSAYVAQSPPSYSPPLRTICLIKRLRRRLLPTGTRRLLGDRWNPRLQRNYPRKAHKRRMLNNDRYVQEIRHQESRPACRGHSAIPIPPLHCFPPTQVNRQKSNRWYHSSWISSLKPQRRRLARGNIRECNSKPLNHP